MVAMTTTGKCGEESIKATAKATEPTTDVENAPYREPVESEQQQQRGPEALVNKENRIINCLRGTMIIVLAVVAVVASVGIYKISVKWEIDNFRNDFDVVATRMTQIFLEATAQKILYAYTLSVAITEASKTEFPYSSPPVLHYLGESAAFAGKANRIVWSPLLHNESERITWEAYAQTDPGAINPNICYVCGSKDMVVANPDAELQIGIDVAPRTCQEVEDSGLGGLIPSRGCQNYVPSIVLAKCGCKPRNNSVADNRTNQPFDRVFRLQNGTRAPVVGDTVSFPVWKIASGSSSNAIMFDQMSDSVRARALTIVLESKNATFSDTTIPTDGDYNRLWNGTIEPTPVATLFQPVFRSHDSYDIVGALALDFSWNKYFSESLPLKSDGLFVLIQNSEGRSISYKVKSDSLIFIGEGDFHDRSFDSLHRETTSEQFKSLLFLENMTYKVSIYPSQAFSARYRTSKPGIYAAVVLVTFLCTSAVFVAYDHVVRKRQRKVMQSAIQTDRIVSSLFAARILDRLFATSNENETKADNMRGDTHLLRPTPKAQLRRLFAQPPNTTGTVQIEVATTDPIADFFPRCSVIFADIQGFTAWSSEREPSQVFRLLETVYQAFDQLAKTHGVFKIETVGDCYVAATGVPEAQEDHAVRIVRFAHACIVKMSDLTKSLEAFLGPSTADLLIRIGVHSGPATGGVLRGEKARFQLFGDTVNTAARMESTGNASLIQVSSATAEVLQQSGFSHWLRPREEGISVKGKGEMLTYWADPTVDAEDLPSEAADMISTVLSQASTSSETSAWGSPTLYATLTNDSTSADEKKERLVDWNTDLLQRLLQRIIARRLSTGRCNALRFAPRRTRQSRNESIQLSSNMVSSRDPIQETTECLSMPQFSARTEINHQDPESVVIDPRVRSQLREFVQEVASMYRNNPFHNFEHASHVAMSAWKVMNRIIRPENTDYHKRARRNCRKRVEELTKEIHCSTFGISSDPLMQFAVVFCALVHDADHQGVTNAQLVKEQSAVALRYKNKCVAEQNSVHICWTLLMDARFSDLLCCICADEEERRRFHQLVVNAVIATDIADKELQSSRKARWDNAFAKYESGLACQPCSDYDVNCKATVVFEYVIQASDVAHSMQHWHIYQRWNERLFEERYAAYQLGREPSDPSIGWYEGELWFFDNYIIPLARKLEHCGVFGVSSDEYLNYAVENRHEWEIKGREIVKGMVEKYCCKTKTTGE